MGGDLGACVGCSHAGSRDGSSTKWKHVATVPFWAELGQWYSSVGGAWTHERHLQASPLEVGERLCLRSGCVAAMYANFKRQLLKEEKGSRHHADRAIFAHGSIPFYGVAGTNARLWGWESYFSTAVVLLPLMCFYVEYWRTLSTAAQHDRIETYRLVYTYP